MEAEGKKLLQQSADVFGSGLLKSADALESDYPVVQLADWLITMMSSLAEELATSYDQAIQFRRETREALSWAGLEAEALRLAGELWRSHEAHHSHAPIAG